MTSCNNFLIYLDIYTMQWAVSLYILFIEKFIILFKSNICDLSNVPPGSPGRQIQTKLRNLSYQTPRRSEFIFLLCENNISSYHQDSLLTDQP